MSNQVISLTSSDEEDSAEPLPKKRKVTPNLPECTVTLVTLKPTESASPTIETVFLDSDDEISENKNNSIKKTSKSVDSVEKPVKIKNCIDKVDLISLTDDEEHDDNISREESKVNGESNLDLRANGVEISAKNPETVSIDDSDTEVKTASKELEGSLDKEKTNNIKTVKQDKEKNNHSIVIDDSDDETEKENHCENEPIESFPVHIEKTSANEVASASTSKSNKKHLNEKASISKSQKEASLIIASKGQSDHQDELEEAKGLFKQFIRIIEEKIVDSSFEEILPKKVPIIKKYFNRSGSYVNDKAFKNLLIDSIERIRKASTANGANSAVLSFHKVFENLKAHVAEITIVVEEDNLPKIKKLEHTLKLLRKRIHQLETAEVNFDDDEDSAYIMLDRYQSRLKKVYAKYCQYINRNPYSGRATYDRITFVNSSYNEINRAITRKYKNSLIFPSYYELESFIQTVAKKEKLTLSDSDIKIESKKCFKVLGNILQKKRRQELYDSHLDFVESSDDPATKDISLENVLKKNQVEGQEKIEKLYQKYVNKQERGEDHVSTDEEQSSDEGVEENKDDKGKAKKINKITIKKKGNKTETEDSKMKKENQGKHNNNRNDVEKDQEEKIVKNPYFKNDIEEERKDNPEIEVNPEDKHNNSKDIHKQNEGDLKETPEKELDNQGKNVKNTADIEDDKTETQEGFLSILKIQNKKYLDQSKVDTKN